MKQPNAEQAVVEREKIADDLIATFHPDNGGKAEFLGRCGFHRDGWKALTDALLRLAREAEVSHCSTSAHRAKACPRALKSPGKMALQPSAAAAIVRA